MTFMVKSNTQYLKVEDVHPTYYACSATVILTYLREDA